MTQPNPSPSSFMRQNERNASRTRSRRGKSPSGRMSRWPCKDYLKGTCNNSFCEKWHPPECLCYKTKSGCRFGKSARMHIVRLMNNLVKGPKRMMTKVQYPCWRRMICTKAYGNLLSTVTKVTRDRGHRISSVIPVMCWNKDLLDVDHRTHDSWVASFKTWSRRSLSYGRAQTADTNPTCEIHESYCTSH